MSALSFELVFDSLLTRSLFSLPLSFLNEVEEAEDGFDVVASMFSKGLFGPQQLGERPA